VVANVRDKPNVSVALSASSMTLLVATAWWTARAAHPTLRAGALQRSKGEIQVLEECSVQD